MEEDSSTHPLILQMINEVADFISASDFRTFYETHKQSANWIPHTLVVYIFNIFSVFVKTAKNPSVVRKYKINNTISYDDFNLSSLMISSLIDQMRLCTATGSLQVLFASPTSSFKLFCPHLIATEPTKRPRENDKIPESKFPKREGSKGSVKNTTGKRLWLPNTLEGKYCIDFLELGNTCKHGADCRFKHAVFPGGFIGNDANKFEEFVKNTDGLSLVRKNDGDKKVSASE
jgi:hypothetical protein